MCGMLPRSLHDSETTIGVMLQCDGACIQRYKKMFSNPIGVQNTFSPAPQDDKFASIDSRIMHLKVELDNVRPHQCLLGRGIVISSQ